MNKKIIQLLITILLLFVRSAFPDTTYVSGTPEENVWEITGSPYIIVGNVNVSGGLYIYAGSEVIFRTNCVIKVSGFHVEGIPYAPVIFRGETGTEKCRIENQIWNTDVKYANFTNTSFIVGGRVGMQFSNCYFSGASENYIIKSVGSSTHTRIFDCEFIGSSSIRAFHSQPFGYDWIYCGPVLLWARNCSFTGFGNLVLYLNTAHETRIENCTFINNNSMVIDGTISQGFIRGCEFINNTRGCISLKHSSFLIEKNMFVSNRGTDGGTISFKPYAEAEFFNDRYEIFNNIFIRNRATRGGVIYSDDSTLTVIANNTMYNNTASIGDAMYLTGFNRCVIFNNIIKDNFSYGIPDIHLDFSSLITGIIVYNILDTIHPGPYSVADSNLIYIPNFHGLPEYVDTTGLDFRLTKESFGVDMGIACVTNPFYDPDYDPWFAYYDWLDEEYVYAPAYDLNNVPRPLGLEFEIGAFEFVDTLFCFNLDGGWNLISISKIVANPAISSLLPFAMSPVFGYNANTRSYYGEDNLKFRKGYWLYSAIDSLVPYIGNIVNTYTDTLYPGWNLIGALSSPIPASQLTAYPEVESPLYGYTTLIASYETADTLYPGYGYWVLATDTVEFTIYIPDSRKSHDSLSPRR